jgi:tRNA-intron endonuclease
MAASGRFVKDRVVVGDEKETNQLYNKGRFGAISNRKLELSLIEALYLIEHGSLEVVDGRNKPMDYETFLGRASRREPRFWIRFCVYRNIRGRGYITKTALKYGADFRVYGRGQEPGKSHAKWVLYAVSENEQFDWKKFAAMNRVAHSVRKKLMVGILDDEGDVTYYQVSWMKP